MIHSASKIEVDIFDNSPENGPAQLFTLRNEKGLKAGITNFGGIIQSLHVPDKNGVPADVVLGFNDIQTYLNENTYAGATVGRIAGRLSNGKFTLNGQNYQLAQNEGTTHLHGGILAMDKKLWNHEIVERDGHESLKLSYLSPHMEEGYPGNVHINTYYSLTEENGLKIEFEATSDQATPLCLTNHSYFNLAGDGNRTIKDHKLFIAADHYHTTDDDFCFLGKSAHVDKSNDFTRQTSVGDKLHLLKQGHGDMYVNKNRGELQKVAEVVEPDSGRKMEVLTTQACTQFYAGKHLSTKANGKAGVPYSAFSGLCLECQGFPDSPNHIGFESIILNPGKVYNEIIEYRFSTTT